jgi:hypothetical protein
MMLAVIGLVLAPRPVQADMIDLASGWRVFSPSISQADLNAIFTVGNLPAKNTDPIPLTINLTFTQVTTIPFVFTNIVTLKDYTDANKYKADPTKNPNALSRFASTANITNNTNQTWIGFDLRIADNLPGKALINSPPDVLHPEPAHFHAGTNGAFATSLDPFMNFSTTPTVNPTKSDFGVSELTAFNGELPPQSVDPMNSVWKPKGINIHDNLTFDTAGNNTTSFTLFLTPITVPEPSSITLLMLGIAGMGLCAARRKLARAE